MRPKETSHNGQQYKSHPPSQSITFNEVWRQDSTGGEQTFYITNIYFQSESNNNGGGNETMTTAWWNGLNIAWDNFGYDIGSSTPLNTTWFQMFFETCMENEINLARFLVHHCD